MLDALAEFRARRRGRCWWALPVFPAYVASEHALLLVSLREQGALPEVMACPTPASTMLDGLVFRALRLWWRHRWLWLLLALCAGHPVSGFLGQGLLTVFLSYLALAGAAWSDSEDDVLGRNLLALLCGVALVLVPLLFPVVVLALRWLAAAGLRRSARVSPNRIAPRWLRWSWLANPIVYREWMRERHLFLSLPLFFLHGAWVAGLIWLMAQSLRASYRTVGALVDERERRTLESLLSAGIERRAFVDGWAAVGCFPRVLECLLGVLVVGWAPMLLAVSASVCGAYLGLAVSVSSASRREACDKLGLRLLFVWLAGVAALLVSVLWSSWLSVPAAAAMGVWAGRLRWAALKQLGAKEMRVRAHTAPQGSRERLMARLKSEGLLAAALD